MTRVLVTGASGLLGANVVLGWIERHEVIGVTHAGRLRHPGLHVRQTDLAAPGAARRLFDEVRPQAVIHCAAATDVEACERDPSMAHRLNAEMAGAVAKAAAEAGARLVHVSTDAVFDGQGGPYREDDVPAPVNEYGRSKLAGEAAVRAADPTALIVRTNFFGWNAKAKNNLAEWFLDRLRSGREAPGFTDVFWSPLLVNDLAELLDQLMSAAVQGILHIPGRDCLSKYEFGRLVARAFGLPLEAVVPGEARQGGFQAPRPGRTCLDGSKASALLSRELPAAAAGLQRMESLARTGYLDRLRSMTTG